MASAEPSANNAPMPTLPADQDALPLLAISWRSIAQPFGHLPSVVNSSLSFPKGEPVLFLGNGGI